MLSYCFTEDDAYLRLVPGNLNRELTEHFLKPRLLLQIQKKIINVLCTLLYVVFRKRRH